MHFVCVGFLGHSYKPRPVAAVFSRWFTMPNDKDLIASAIPIEERDWTPQEWRARKHISKSTHLKLKEVGLAPEEEVIAIPGFKIARITPEARRDWQRKITELRQSKEAELESARRQAQVVAAGRLAAQSPNHVSKNRGRPEQRRRRR
jgi:hypothetical protein